MVLSEDKYNTAEMVEKHVCQVFDIDKSSLISRCISETPSTARYYLWYILHYQYDFSITEVACMYNRDRRTIFLGIAKVRYGIKHQPYYQLPYNELMKRLKPQS